MGMWIQSNSIMWKNYKKKLQMKRYINPPLVLDGLTEVFVHLCFIVSYDTILFPHNSKVFWTVIVRSIISSRCIPYKSFLVCFISVTSLKNIERIRDINELYIISINICRFSLRLNYSLTPDSSQLLCSLRGRLIEILPYYEIATIII